MKVGDSTDVSAPHSEENIDATDFHKIIEGLESSQTDSNRLKQVKERTWYMGNVRV